MENNIVTAIHNRAAEKKFVCLRFNYRGAGKSEGNKDKSKGINNVKSFWENSCSPMDELRIQDVSGAINFLKEIIGSAEDNIFLAGYSFGAYAAQQTAVGYPHLKGLVLIAPTIHFHDFTPVNRITIPKLVISSDDDFSYSMEELDRVYSNFSAPKSLKIFHGAGHFFVRREEEVCSCVTEFMTNLRDQGTLSE
jgi:hypothetical protein